ncbi:hypothetical protein HK405_008401, partial [Cladochytrium tenue]
QEALDDADPASAATGSIRVESADTDSASPLFALPRESRDLIFEFAVSAAEDPAADAAYAANTCYRRPGYSAPRRSLITVYLTGDDRRPERTTSVEELAGRLARIAALQGRSGGRLKAAPEVAHGRVFAQLYLLESGLALQEVLRLAGLRPRRVTLTLRHTDWWFMERDEPLHFKSARFVNVCRFPVSVRELESLERKRTQLSVVNELNNEVRSSSAASSATLKVVATQEVPGQELALENIQLTTSKASVVAKGPVLSFKFWIGLKFDSEVERDECAQLVRRLALSVTEASTADSQTMVLSQLDPPIPSMRDIAGSVPRSLSESGGGTQRSMEEVSITAPRYTGLSNSGEAAFNPIQKPLTPPAATVTLMPPTAAPRGSPGAPEGVADADQGESGPARGSDVGWPLWFRDHEPQQLAADIDAVLKDPGFPAFSHMVLRRMLARAGVSRSAPETINIRTSQETLPPSDQGA